MHGCSKENFCLICGRKSQVYIEVIGGIASHYADLLWVVPVLHCIVVLCYVIQHSRTKGKEEYRTGHTNLPCL